MDKKNGAKGPSNAPQSQYGAFIPSFANHG
jgi:hypothetical protein